MARDTAVDPFGATVDGANALTPETRLLDTPPAPGQFGVTVGQAEAWVRELSGRVAMRLAGWERLEGSLRDQLIAAARDVVHNGAASYIEDARHPERATVNATSYGAVLWARFTAGLDEVAAWLEARFTDPALPDEPGADGTLVTATGAASFPPVTFRDGFRF